MRACQVVRVKKEGKRSEALIPRAVRSLGRGRGLRVGSGVKGWWGGRFTGVAEAASGGIGNHIRSHLCIIDIVGRD